MALGALVLGKSVLIADMLPIINRYPDKPLAYNVAWNTATFLFHYLERLVDFWKEVGGFERIREMFFGQPGKVAA